MFNNIVFIGGIHGVGKGTVCNLIANEINIIHLSASEVLKWKEINTDEKNKKVKDIFETQDRLINGLQRIIIPNSYYLLDGHFCLFDKEGNINKVPLKTFRNISPILIAVVICNVTVIKKRLEERDAKIYEYNVLEAMQNAEIAYGKEVAKQLHIPYVETFDGDPEKIIEAVKPLMK